MFIEEEHTRDRRTGAAHSSPEPLGAAGSQLTGAAHSSPESGAGGAAHAPERRTDPTVLLDTPENYSKQ